MTIRDTPYPDGTPCWIDLMVPDPRMAMDFYGALFSWSFADQGDEAGNYLLCSLDGRIVAGLGATPPDEPAPPVWTTYLAASDVEVTADAVERAGGRIITPPTDVMPRGRLAVAADPGDAVFALWQAGTTVGAELTDVPSALVWNECMTRDYEGAKAFYGSVFGYTVNDMADEGFTYGTLLVDERIIGGLGLLPPETPADVPAHWMTYFAVTDTDAAATRVTELGGSVTAEPIDTPYGRMATVADNQGVAFSLVSVTAESDVER